MSHEEKTLLAVLFAAGEPISLDRLQKSIELDEKKTVEFLDLLKIRLSDLDMPFTLVRLDNSYQLCSLAEYADVIRQALEVKKNIPLSQAAMEVLAIVAYNQPVTRAFVDEIRGVDSYSPVNSLVEKGLLEEAGRLDIPGRPISYVTTQNFLRCFGLEDLRELPTVLEERTPDDLPLEESLEVEEDVLEGQIEF